MGLKEFLKESNFTEGEKVIYNNEEFEVMEVSKKMIKIVSKDGKEIIDVLPKELKKK